MHAYRHRDSVGCYSKLGPVPSPRLSKLLMLVTSKATVKIYFFLEINIEKTLLKYKIYWRLHINHKSK